jgi:hypothetical protein
VAVLDHEHRVVELSRMLSGQPDSATARRHAEELLVTAAGQGSGPAGNQINGQGGDQGGNR